MDADYVLCECPLERLVELVKGLEPAYEVSIPQPPHICLTMLRARDSVEQQEFFLGEALTSQCEVVVNQVSGYGLVLEDQPQRVYCLAVLDALLRLKDHNEARIRQFIAEEGKALQQKEQQEHTQIMQSAVDFKLMEEA